MATYAKGTDVASEKSRAEIERILQRYGASAFMYAWQGDKSLVAFQYGPYHIRLLVPMPDRNDREYTHHSRGRRTNDAAAKAWEQATRQRWLEVALLIKAKLEGIESSITTFEEEFLMRGVLPNGQAVVDWIVPQVRAATVAGQMPKLLLGEE